MKKEYKKDHQFTAATSHQQSGQKWQTVAYVSSGTTHCSLSFSLSTLLSFFLNYSESHKAAPIGICRGNGNSSNTN